VNKELYGSKVPLPEEVMTYLQQCHDAAHGADENTEGFRRNKELRDSREISYQQLNQHLPRNCYPNLKLLYL
jgi:hypothetical protein